MNRKCVIPFILMLSAMCAPIQNAEAFQLFSLHAQSSAPADYYEQAQGKTGEALKQALHDTIDDHRELSYSEVWEALKATDEDPANRNNVILLYSRESRSKQANGGQTGDWNREHVWAKSHGDFGTSKGPGTDLHHLRPSDV